MLLLFALCSFRAADRPRGPIGPLADTLDRTMAQKSPQTITSVEHIPASEHGKGFPPFAKETFASQIVWLVITFVALYLLISRIAVPRIGGIFEERDRRIQGDFADGQRAK